MKDEKILESLTEGKQFTYEQISIIIRGINVELPIEKIKIYADPKFDHRQMQEIESGIEHGLSIDQIMVYANPAFCANVIIRCNKYV